MKKIFTLLFIMVAAVETAGAQADLYLRCNLNATEANEWKSWDNDLTEYKFTYDNDNGTEWVYSYTIDAKEWTEDIQFRLHKTDWGGTQQIPYQGATVEWLFSNKLQETYEIKAREADFKSDNYSDKYFTIKHTNVGASEYKITIYWRQSDDRIWMVIDLISMPVSVSSYGMSTFSSKYPLDFTDVEGISAYKITGIGENSTLTKEAVTKVPANTGLYIKGTASGNFQIPTTATATSIGSNMLVAGTGALVSQTDGDMTNYILTVNTVKGDVSTPRFYKVNEEGNTVSAGKAYLQIPTESAAREFFWFDNEATGVDVVQADRQTADGPAYNLAGQRVKQTSKGLYIVGGKKVVR